MNFRLYIAASALTFGLALAAPSWLGEGLAAMEPRQDCVCVDDSGLCGGCYMGGTCVVHCP